MVGGKAISGKGSRMGGSNEKRAHAATGFGTDAYVTGEPPTHLPLTASPRAPFPSPVHLLTPVCCRPLTVRDRDVVLPAYLVQFLSEVLIPLILRRIWIYNKTGIAIILQCPDHPSSCYMSLKTLATPPLFISLD